MFSHMFLLFQLLLLVFLRNRYLLISLRLSRLHGNPISRPVSHTIGTPSQYIVHAPPCFWHRTCGFLETRRSWEPGSSLTTGELSLFRLLPKVSAVSVLWTEHDSTKILELTFSCMTSAQPSYAVQPGYGINKWISKLVNRVIVACLMTASSRFAQSDSAGLPCYEILRSGIFNVPLPYGMHLKVSHEGCHIFEQLRPQQHRSTVDETRNSRG